MELNESLAYDGSSAPQRGNLSVLQRDIICRLITNELARMRDVVRHPEHYPDIFLTLTDVREAALLVSAREILDPRFVERESDA